MPTYVKAHRRGKSMVRAHERISSVKMIKIKGQSYRDKPSIFTHKAYIATMSVHGETLERKLRRGSRIFKRGRKHHTPIRINVY